ncbi:MAG: PhzF family phenazine biosynthesis protein, partial [Anaerolineaceae bacterium]
MSTPIYQVDSFTGVPFRGNPAGVCILSTPQQDEWMKSVAAEMNLSETAFLLKEDAAYRLRWFTPRVEVSLCGHATLAAAHFLWESGREPLTSRLTFRTIKGDLSAGFQDGWIELDFPAHSVVEANPPDGLLKALGVDAEYVGQYSNSYLVEVANEAQLRAMMPDMDRLERVQTRSVAVTARSETAPYDFVSRYFA